MTDQDFQPERRAGAKPLSSDDEIVVAEVVAQAAGAALPLPESLRAAAEDVASARVSAVLRQLAEQLEQGGTLDELCEDPQQRSPGFVSALIRAGQRSGDLAAALVEWMDCRRAVRQTWRSVVAAMLYPAVLLTLLIFVLVGMDYFLVEPLLSMYDDFELELPVVTKVLARVHRHLLPVLLIGGCSVAGFLLFYRLLAGPVRWRRLLTVLPLVGMLWHWTGVMELSRLLAVLLRRRLPLPEALRLAANGVHDANMRQISLQLAEGVQEGTALSQLMNSTYRLPASLVPLVRWGEQTGQLPEAFELAGKMYEGRARLRAELLAALLPPLVFVVVATAIPLFLIGLYAPVIAMIQGLS